MDNHSFEILQILLAALFTALLAAVGGLCIFILTRMENSIVEIRTLTIEKWAGLTTQTAQAQLDSAVIIQCLKDNGFMS